MTDTRIEMPMSMPNIVDQSGKDYKTQQRPKQSPKEQ